MANTNRDQQPNRPHPDRDRRKGGEHHHDEAAQRPSDEANRSRTLGGYEDGDTFSSRGNEFGNAGNYGSGTNYGTGSDYGASGNYGTGGGDMGPTPSPRPPRPLERQRWDDDGGNLPSHQRRSPDQGGHTTEWYRQQAAWNEGRERWLAGTNAGARVSHRGKGPKNFKRSDEQIQHEISQRLFDHHDIDASDIEVIFANGEATLTGTVPDRHMKRLANDCVEECPGVSNCQNNLRVSAARHDSNKTPTRES